MSVDAIIWIGIAVISFLTVAVSGPGLWSNRSDYPLIQGPYRFVKRLITDLMKDPPPPSGTRDQ